MTEIASRSRERSAREPVRLSATGDNGFPTPKYDTRRQEVSLLGDGVVVRLHVTEGELLASARSSLVTMVRRKYRGRLARCLQVDAGIARKERFAVLQLARSRIWTQL